MVSWPEARAVIKLTCAVFVHENQDPALRDTGAWEERDQTGHILWRVNENCINR